MRRGTTPTITVSVDADITDMSIHLAFKCGSRLIVKQGDDLTVEAVDGGTEITTILTQQDTLAMRSGGDVDVQIRAVKQDGDVAIATTIGKLPVKRILEEGYINE